MAEKHEIITAADVGAYFGRTWRHKACPFCGCEKWVIAMSEKGLLVTANVAEYHQEVADSVIHSGSIEDAGKGVLAGEAVISIRCTRCHFVAHFDFERVRSEIEKWQDQQELSGIR